MVEMACRGRNSLNDTDIISNITLRVLVSVLIGGQDSIYLHKLCFLEDQEPLGS